MKKRKYFIDTEFIEGKQEFDKTPDRLYLFWMVCLVVLCFIAQAMTNNIFATSCTFIAGAVGLWLMETVKRDNPETIELISIAIVTNADRYLYLICKEFNVTEAWRRYQVEDSGNTKVYWIRENVLRPIYIDLHNRYWNDCTRLRDKGASVEMPQFNFTLKDLKHLISIYGLTKEQIKNQVISFVTPEFYQTDGEGSLPRNRLADNPISFYGYYADYDWVVFCWLFGKMNDLPEGFSMYCNDLKQRLDEYAESLKGFSESLEFRLEQIKKDINYPKNHGVHDALHDAKWNRDLYLFLNR